MSITRTCPTCGFSGTYATQRSAAYHHGRHSCSRHLHLTDLAQRRAERAAGGPQSNCCHRRTRHVHGTRAAYVKDRCRCRPCTVANTAESRATRREKIYGRWQPFVDAEPVREHIQVLRRAGFGLRRIAELADVSTTTLRAILDNTLGTRRPRAKVRTETADAVLAITPDRAARAAYSTVDPTGTRRRLEALVAIGWSLQQLAQQLSRTPTHLTRTMSSSAVTVRTAEQISALYDRLWDVCPAQETSADRATVEATRTMAAKNGWLPPLAWDDIDTDPNPQHPDRFAATTDDLDEIAIERAAAGDGIRLEQLTPAEQHEVVRRMTKRGKSIRDIASQLGTTKRTVSRRRASAA